MQLLHSPEPERHELQAAPMVLTDEQQFPPRQMSLIHSMLELQEMPDADFAIQVELMR